MWPQAADPHLSTSMVLPSLLSRFAWSLASPGVFVNNQISSTPSSPAVPDSRSGDWESTLLPLECAESPMRLLRGEEVEGSVEPDVGQLDGGPSTL